MKAKELAKLLLEHPDLEVEICFSETVWAYNTERIRCMAYDEFNVDVVSGTNGAIVQIDCSL